LRAALALLVAAGVLVLGVAACGDSGGPLSKSEYESRMGALVHDASTSQILGGKSVDFTSVPGYFRKLSKDLADIAAKAKAIQPPRDVADVHARIVAGFEQEAAITNRFADGLDGANVARVKVLLRQFDSSGFRAAYQELDAAGKALAARGYRISSSGGK
jgi:hypothetical protein